MGVSVSYWSGSVESPTSPTVLTKEYPDATGWSTESDGNLEVYDPAKRVATYAKGDWTRVEATDAPSTVH